MPVQSCVSCSKLDDLNNNANTHILNVLRYEESVNTAESKLSYQNEEYHKVPARSNCTSENQRHLE